MTNLILTSVIFVVLLLCSVKISDSSDGWEANIIVSLGGAENRLTLGQRPDATDGKDDKYDVTAMPGGDMKASFSGTLWRDINEKGSLIRSTPVSVFCWNIPSAPSQSNDFKI